jgi:MarR family transcriptional regulator, organic hydroperoxide resistance regulator
MRGDARLVLIPNGRGSRHNQAFTHCGFPTSTSMTATRQNDQAPSTINIPTLSGKGNETEFRDFMAELFAAATTMQSLRRKAARLFNLSSTELAILLAVSKLGNDKSIREIAEHLDISASNVTADVSRLVESSYLRKAAHPEDARAVSVGLTAAGAKLVKGMAPVLQYVNDAVFSELSRDDMLRCSRVLKSIVGQARQIDSAGLGAIGKKTLSRKR